MTAAASKLQVWDGVYPTFAHAARDAVGPGFSGETYEARALSATRDCLDALAEGRPIPSFHKQRSTVLPAIVAMQLRPPSTLRIIDFGGGLGIGYLTLVECLGPAVGTIDYTVVEIAPVCATGRTLFPHGEIRFVDTLPDEPFDLVHSASALQYVEDWRGLLAGLCRYKAPYMLLSDVFAGSVTTFATLQNYYESRIAHWFLNIDELLQALSSLGYRLLMKSFVSARRLGVDDVLPMENFPPDRRLHQTLHLLLRRVS